MTLRLSRGLYGLVLGPSTALNIPFQKHCTVTNKAIWDYMTSLVQTSSEATGSWYSSPLIVSRNSFSHQTWAHFQTGGAQPALFGCHYIYVWYHYLYFWYYLCCLCIDFSELSAWCCCWFVVYIRRFIHKSKCVSFWLHGCCGEWEGRVR